MSPKRHFAEEQIELGMRYGAKARRSERRRGDWCYRFSLTDIRLQLDKSDPIDICLLMSRHHIY
jgi:hypothetical protein